MKSLCFCIFKRPLETKKLHRERSSSMASEKKRIKETFYISHGSPMLAIDDSLHAHNFLESFRETIFTEKPKAIIIISGHWETAEPAVNAISGVTDTIYDFYGFPKEMYQLRYPAPGSPDLADKVRNLLQKSGFPRVHIDTRRGLDHGAWVPLKLMYPAADIPVCQLSVQTRRDAEHHFRIGKALAPLRDEGVLIVGSGSATHNLRLIDMNVGGKVMPWAEEFDTWLRKALVEGRYGDVVEYEKKAPHARLAHPRPDHFYPLHVAVGAAGENATAEMVHHDWSHGSISYASYKFTETDE